MNKLRETEDKYGRDGHAFSFNSEILYTYDVCGNCEAHALLFGLEKGLAPTLNSAPFLKDLQKHSVAKDSNDFKNCPF